MRRQAVQYITAATRRRAHFRQSQLFPRPGSIRQRFQLLYSAARQLAYSGHHRQAILPPLGRFRVRLTRFGHWPPHSGLRIIAQYLCWPPFIAVNGPSSFGSRTVHTAHPFTTSGCRRPRSRRLGTGNRHSGAHHAAPGFGRAAAASHRARAFGRRHRWQAARYRSPGTSPALIAA